MSEDQVCSFCGRSKKMAKIMVESKKLSNDKIYICGKCVDDCVHLIEKSKSKNIDNGDYLKPHEIRARLDEYIIGQEQAKLTVSVAVYNHYKRLRSKSISIDTEVQKSNILMLGPTGTGKTYIAKTLARIIDVPFAIADATTLTEAGYVGEDVSNIIAKLYQNSNYDLERTERGIVFVDEIDKIARSPASRSLSHDVNGEGVQQALLKLIEGTVVNVQPEGGRKHSGAEYVHVDTTGILFIFGGAFSGMDEIIDRRVSIKSIGFGANIKSPDKNTKEIDELLAMISTEDLLSFGLIPEFIGRIPVTVTLEHLDETALVDILTKPKDALTKQYEILFQLDNCVLEFTDAAVLAIAQKAIKKRTGARGLKSIIEKAMLKIMYDVPQDETIRRVIISEDVINETGEPEILYEEKQVMEKVE